MHLAQSLLAFAALCVAVDAVGVRAACNRDNCFRQIAGTGNKIAVSARLTDCSSLQTAVVTASAKIITTTITTTASNPSVQIVSKRDAKIPAYASSCKNLAAYASACSCAGVSVGILTTTPTITSTVTIIVTPTLSSSTTTTAMPASFSPITATETSVHPQTPDASPTVGTASPTPVLPTATDVRGVLRASAHPMDAGLDNGDGTRFVMNSTIYARDGSSVVNLESFIPFITDVKCSTDVIKFTFTTEEAGRLASSNWQSSFVLMTSGAKYCGNAFSRSFFDVYFDALTAELSVAPTTIKDSLGRVVVSFDTIKTDPKLAGVKQKRAGQDGSTWFHIDTTRFPQWFNDFTGGVKAGYEAVVDLKPIDPNTLNGQKNDHQDQSIQCPDCGLTAWVNLYGGYDINIFPPHTNYAHVGFRVQDALFKSAFGVHVDEGYSIDRFDVLQEAKLPGITVEGLLTIGPVIKLASLVRLAVSKGVMNVEDLGIEYRAQQDLVFELDFKNRGASSSGWVDLAPKVKTPRVSQIPEQVTFTGAIGPEFGIYMSVLGGWVIDAEATVGLELPTIQVQVSPRSSRDGCSTDQLDQGSNPRALSINAQAGIGVFVGYDISQKLIGGIADGHIEVYNYRWDAGSTCLVLSDNQINNPLAGLNCYPCAF